MPNEIISIMKAMHLLSVFDEERREFGVHELSRIIGYHKSTVHRILVTLERGDFVYKSSRTGKYRLGYKLYKLGNMVVPVKQLRECSEPYLKDLRESTGESVNLVLLDGREVLYVSRIQGRHRMQLLDRLGSSMPLHCTAVGKVLLASMQDSELENLLKGYQLKALTKNTITSMEALRKELKKVADRGYAIDNCEYEVGCRCIAAPVRDYSGKVVAALAIAGTSSRVTLKKAPSLAAIVMRIARRISERLKKTV